MSCTPIPAKAQALYLPVICKGISGSQIRILKPQEVFAIVSLLLNPKLPVTVHTSVSFGKPGAGKLAQVCSCVSWAHDEQLSRGGGC